MFLGQGRCGFGLESESADDRDLSVMSVVDAISGILGRRRREARAQAEKHGYQASSVRLYIKPYCGWCSQAMDWLDARKIRYEVLDVIGDREAYEAMVRLSGQTLAPVIEVDGRVLADFGTRELAAFWARLGSASSPS